MSAHPGRPRNAHTRDQILHAALSLSRESGVRGITMEAIAHRAGAGKATLYRWWPSRTALVTEAFALAVNPGLPLPDTGSVAGDLRVQLAGILNFLRSPDGSLFRQILAEGVTDTAHTDTCSMLFFSPHRLVTGHILRRGVARGELAAHTDAALLTTMLHGTISFRVCVLNEAMDEDELPDLISATLASVSATNTPAHV